MSKKKLLILLSVFVLIGLISISSLVKIPYSIYSRGIVIPVKEWTLSKVGDGNLLNVMKDNLTGSISYFSINEFQRGDAMEFTLSDAIFKNTKIKKGDTIGYIFSKDIERRLIDVSGALEEQLYLLEVYASGQKEEDVKLAQDKIVLAQQELDTEKKNFERFVQLYKDTLISEKEYEVALNNYKIKEQNLIIAQSAYIAVKSGAKPEEIDYIQSRINTLEAQKEQLQKHIGTLSILSPIDGIIVKQQGKNVNNDVVIQIADISQMIVIFPVHFYEKDFIQPGLEVNFSYNSHKNLAVGKLLEADNTLQTLNRRQILFVTSIIEEHTEDILLNMVADVKIVCGKTSLIEYLKRSFQTIYEN